MCVRVRRSEDSGCSLFRFSLTFRGSSADIESVKRLHALTVKGPYPDTSLRRVFHCRARNLQLPHSPANALDKGRMHVRRAIRIHRPRDDMNADRVRQIFIALRRRRQTGLRRSCAWDHNHTGTVTWVALTLLGSCDQPRLGCATMRQTVDRPNRQH
jgi:hypothetical protein